MKYAKFKSILNQIIFEKSKGHLLTKVAEYPHRYIGIFRPTKPKAKLLQNLLQSHEIRFGVAFEAIIEEYLKENNFQILQKKFSTNYGEELNLDYFFKKDHRYYFIEQKVRDDHDSTKKRGQIRNFEKKLEAILDKYGNIPLCGFMYFIDPNLIKNKNFYQIELKKMSDDYNVELYISYGEGLFKKLNIAFVWKEILHHLQKWRRELPDLPEINFDLDPEQSFNEIKNLPPRIFRKLFNDNQLFNEIVLTLFPEKKVLKLLYEYFRKQDLAIYQNLANKLENKL